MNVNASNNLRLTGDWAPSSRKVKRLPWEDLTLINLEGPIVKGQLSQRDACFYPKAGPHVCNGQLPVGLRRALIVLANNHLMDAGIQGLYDSITGIEERGWSCAGAGQQLTQAREPAIVSVGGWKVGVLSRCETQFGIATQWRPGVAPFDATIYRDISDLKSRCDFVIVSVHAAHELSPWPSPSRQDSFRALIDAGADLVHGHHSHVPQGWEVYGGKYIFYSLGNFCVDPNKWKHISNTLWSITPQLDFRRSGVEINVQTIEVEDRVDEVEVRFSSHAERWTHDEYIEVCNAPLSDRRTLEGLWQEVAVKSFHDYYADWLGAETKGTRLRKLLGKAWSAVVQLGATTRLPRLLESEKRNTHQKQLLWYHLFACDSHREAISTALGVLSGELDDMRNAETADWVDRYMP